MSEHAHLKPVTAAPAPTAVAPGLLQRKCACGGSAGLTGDCAECGKKRLQRKPSNRAETEEVPPVVHEVLSASGRPLDPSTRALFESRFGHDFGGVRVHADGRAAESARAVNATAYTVGRDIVFGHGRYNPGSADGRRLLAHELTHVVQQSRLPAPTGAGGLVVGRHDDPLEAQADRAAAAVSVQPFHSPSTAAAGVLQREAAAPQHRASFEGCEEGLQNDLKAKQQPAIEHVDRAIASLGPGWENMDPANKAAFRQYFDPANTGDIDDGFVRDVRGNFRLIRASMSSLTFDCDPASSNLCGDSAKWCVGGRLMWTCWGNLHVCTNAYPGADDHHKIETIIHESTHNALLTTDRAYSNRAEFNQLAPRGSGFFGSLLNFLGNIPVLGLLFRNLPGNNDTINNPDSYSGYAMQV